MKMRMEDSVILENEDGMEIGFTVREVRTSNLVVGTNSVIYDLNDYTIISINGFPVAGHEVTNDLTVSEDDGELFAEKVVNINAAKVQSEEAPEAADKVQAESKTVAKVQVKETAETAPEASEDDSEG